MLITEHFVLLNFPKTGSSFARKVLKDIYAKRKGSNLFLKVAHILKLKSSPIKELFFTHHYYNKIGKTIIDQHGTYSQIPDIYKNKQIVSILRNPYERLVSIYEFKFWQRNPELDKDIIDLHFPNFPDLSIDDYIDYLKLVNKQINFQGSDEAKIGIFTVQFIHFFFKNPENVLKNLNNEYLNSNIIFKKDLADIKFLRQEKLKEDLMSLLKEFSFSEMEIEYIKNHKKVNLTNNIVNNRNDLYTKKLIKYVEDDEYFLIKIFNEIGFYYDKPNIHIK